VPRSAGFQFVGAESPEWHKLTVALVTLGPDWLETCRTHDGEK